MGKYTKPRQSRRMSLKDMNRQVCSRFKEKTVQRSTRLGTAKRRKMGRRTWVWIVNSTLRIHIRIDIKRITIKQQRRKSNLMVTVNNRHKVLANKEAFQQRPNQSLEDMNL